PGADEAWRTLRAAASGEQTQVDLGEAELRIAQRDPHVAGERDLEPAAEAIAVDRGDQRDRRCLDPVGELLDEPRAAVGALEPGDVRSRREGPLAPAAQ